MKFVFILLIISNVLTGCREKTFQTEKEFYSWLNNPENGLIQTKKVNFLKLTVKYLPPEYLAYKDYKSLKNPSETVKDSLLDLYKNSLTFLMTVAPDEEKGNQGDIMYAGVSSYEAYAQKVMELNFNLQSYVSLKTEAGEYIPVLTNMENVYGLTPHRNFYIVFADEGQTNALMQAPELDFTFSDEIFQTGINHFIFNRVDIANVPQLSFWK